MSSSTLHLRTGLGQRSQHVIICGDDGLAHRLAQELDAVCGEAVTVVLPSRRDGHGADVVALHRDPHSPVELLISARPDEQTLRAAGVDRAAALALTYGDDFSSTNRHGSTPKPRPRTVVLLLSGTAGCAQGQERRTRRRRGSVGSPETAAAAR
ncbi:hypothetical protein OG311_31750 [Streptomyces sp. NBC_01343]|uniref:hypothetical protein n=1 Tax=Streptomyces sp. NBC_01343 TaxID=2903832 RepID=UPI002E11E8E0|nr:hypothetical protein OG311_31750 [Streptomyces sp. NBC_01343]